MIDISSAKAKIDIVEFASKYVELHKKSGKLWACCPIHHEKTPSFSIDPVRQNFKCFGCGAGGDVISLAMKLNGLTFQDALRFLGIEQGKVTHVSRMEIASIKRKKALIERFRAWERTYSTEIGAGIVQAYKLIDDDWEFRGLYHIIAIWEYYMTILMSGDDKLKHDLYREVSCGRSL